MHQHKNHGMEETDMIKNFMIFGDSYSTHKDYIPEGYPCFYYSEGRNPEEPVTKMLPTQTWWGRLMENTGATLIQNNSWSGSTVGHTGYEGDCSQTSSFICRYRQLLASGFFEKNRIDTFLVFGGTNDSWSDAPLGTEMFSDWQESDLFCVLPAICYFMAKLKQNHPKARIVFIANCDIKEEIVACIQNASQRLGVECVTLHDIDKFTGHPTILGMEQICRQIMEQLNLKLP